MSQLRYDILSQLVLQSNHIRGLAATLEVNQMSVARMLHQLELENIVDYIHQGKNKSYSLKTSIEVQAALKMMEYAKLLQALVKAPRLRAITAAISEEKQIPLAIIFGSYARNTQTPASDIDLYIETRDRELKKKLEQLDSKLSIKMGSFDVTGHLAQEIIKHHIILKGVDRYHELLHHQTQNGRKNYAHTVK